MNEKAGEPAPRRSEPRPRRSARDTIRRARRGVAAARADDVFLYSAALAFYGLISVAPLVVVALWITSLLVGPTQIHHAAGDLARFSPQALGADRALERVAHLGTKLGLLAVAAALWPATAYGSALVRVLDRLTGDRAATGLRRRGAALLLVCVVPVLVLGSLVASYAGAAHLGDSVVEIAVGLGVALVFGFTATAMTVGFIYRVFPRTKLGWRSTIRGTLMAAASISVLSVAYGGLPAAGGQLRAPVRVGCSRCRGATRPVALRRQHRVARRLPSSASTRPGRSGLRRKARCYPIAVLNLSRSCLAAIAGSDLAPVRQEPGSNVAASSTACSIPRAALGVHEKVQHLANGPFPADRVPQRQVVLDVVPVAPTVSFLHHVAGFGEVHDDAVGGALGDVERDGEIT